MRRNTLRTRLAYRARAWWRSVLAWWNGVQAFVAEVWANNVIAEQPQPRVVIYPRRGEASSGQIAEFRVIRTSDKVPVGEMVDNYLRMLERISGPFPKVTQ
jgi:hypothetical protein